MQLEVANDQMKIFFGKDNEKVQINGISAMKQFKLSDFKVHWKQQAHQNYEVCFK